MKQEEHFAWRERMMRERIESLQRAHDNLLSFPHQKEGLEAVTKELEKAWDQYHQRPLVCRDPTLFQQESAIAEAARKGRTGGAMMALSLVIVASTVAVLIVRWCA